ncbi:MAG: hypothetical protein AAF950_14805 [Pseudomonadota bacterium]
MSIKITEPLPDSVEIVTSTDRILKQFSQLCEHRHTPIGMTERSRNYHFYWPKPPLATRALPGGSASLDAEDGYDYADRLFSFFTKASLGDLYFWAIGNPEIGVFRGEFSYEIAWWVRRNIIVTPTVLLSGSGDFVMISDEQWHISVIGAPHETITTLENEFGGAQCLKRNFLNYSEKGFVGFGAEGTDWAYKYPIEWCGWS